VVVASHWKRDGRRRAAAVHEHEGATRDPLRDIRQRAKPGNAEFGRAVDANRDSFGNGERRTGECRTIFVKGRRQQHAIVAREHDVTWDDETRARALLPQLAHLARQQ